MIKKTWLTLWRASLVLAAIAAILIAAAGLALRFWIMPGVEQYKPRIVQAISDATGLSARLTQVSARWDGLRPVLTLQGIEFYDAEGRSVLRFNRVEGVLSWWSVPALKPQFVALEIAQPNLVVRRDPQGRVFIAGVLLSDQQSGQSGFGEWLLHQPSISVRGAELEWIDELRGKAPLKLSDTDLTLENHGSERKLSLRARPPAHLAAEVQLVAELRGTDPRKLEQWSGKVYAAATSANLVTINDYLAVDSKLKSGLGSVKAWVDLDNGSIGAVTAEVDLRDVNARLREDLATLNLTNLAGRFAYTQNSQQRQLVTQGLQGQFASPRVGLASTNLELTLQASSGNGTEQGSLKANQIDLGAVVALAAALPLPEADRERLRTWMPAGVLSAVEAHWEGLEQPGRRFSLRGRFVDLSWRAVDYVPGANGLTGSLDATETGGTISIDSGKSALSLPKVFAETLRFDSLSAQASWQREGVQTVVKIENVGFANADVAGSVFGSYKTAPPTPANQPAPKRAPGWIDLSGKIVRARGENVERYVPLVLGPRVRAWLDRAIETGRGKDATLTLKGDLYHFPFADDQHGIFDIAAQVEDVRLWYANGWPKIERTNGKLHFRGARMEITGEGSMFGARAQNVRAVIPVLGNHKEQLQITGDASAPLQDALQFIAHSPINERLRGRTLGLRGSGAGKLRLQLDVPLREPQLTKVAGEYEFQGNALDDQQRGFPALAQLKGKLQFTKDSVSAQALSAICLGAPVSVDLNSGQQGIEITAKGEADLARLHAEYGHALLKGLTGRARWNGKMQLDAQALRLDIAASGDLFGAPAKFTVARAADGVLKIDGRGSARQTELAKALPEVDWTLIDTVGDWHAQISVTGAKTQIQLDADAVVLGQPARIEVQGPSENLRVAARGSVEARRLAQNYPGVWASRVSGETEWRAELQGFAAAAGGQGSNGAKPKPSMRITSDLRGITSMLPAPFAKGALEALPLSIDILPMQANEDLLRIALGDRAGAQFVRAREANGRVAVPRAAIQFGAAAPAPVAAGLTVAGSVQDFDLGAWLDLQRDAAAPRVVAVPASRSALALPALRAIDIRAKNFAAIGRVFNDVSMSVRAQGGGWQVALQGEQLQGRINWLPPGGNSAASGKLTGVFDRIYMPAAPPQAKAAAVSKVPLRPNEFPALDFSVQAFQIKQRRLGALTLLASPEGSTWRINKLLLTSPAAELSATGLWSGVNVTPGTGIEGNWKISDLGAFMDAMGYPATIAGGQAELQGRLAWAGAPFDFDPATLGGELKLSAKEGRFLKADPGAGKLLSLISLQALPRRITLDFRDVFSEGFAFDAIKARVAIALGVLRTDDFEMKGTGARVRMVGAADARAETQNLRIKVLPSLGGTVAVAGTIAGGPVAGVGAYVLQKLLKEPFDEILAYEYDISGSWDDPQVKKVPRATPPERPRPR